jgi:hypothetical protein
MSEFDRTGAIAIDPSEGIRTALVAVELDLVLKGFTLLVPTAMLLLDLFLDSVA